MRFLEFKKRLIDLPVFGLSDIRKSAPDLDPRRLYEWGKKRYIIKVHNGHYVFAEKIAEPEMFFLIANKIYRPSYVSLESALSIYGLIPEHPYTVTSVTTRKTSAFETRAGNYSYRKIKKELFFGYQVKKNGQGEWLLASPEKALLDYIYLNANIEDADDIEGLRINMDELRSRVSAAILGNYTSLIGNERVSRCVKILMKEAGNVRLS